MHPGLTLFIDADDTLWEYNIYFDSVIDRTATRLSEYGVSTERTREALLAIERQRTRAHGYGSLNFGASLEVLCEHVGMAASLDELRPFLRAEIASLHSQLAARESVAEARSQLFHEMLGVMTEKARLEAQLDHVAEQHRAQEKMQELMAENARLKASIELVEMRHSMLKESMQAAVENEKLRLRVAELEQRQSTETEARTAKKLHLEQSQQTK